MLRSGGRWRDCPAAYDPYTTVYNRFNRWSRQGIWFAMFEALTGSTGITATPADMMARCKRLYGMWARYQPPDFMMQSSRGALAQGGLADCQSGHYDTGIAELEQLLKDDRIPFAAGPATPATASR
jgi:hypothetical protein